MNSFKQNIFLGFFIVLLIAVSACIDADRSAEKADEEQAESVETSIRKGLYDHVMEIGGDALPKGDDYLWERTKEIILSIQELEEVSQIPLREQKKELTEIFKENGFKSYKQGYERLEESSRMINYILGIGLQIASLETIELTKGVREAEKAEKEIIKSLEKEGYTQADVKGLDHYDDIIGQSVGLILRLPKP